MILKIAWRNIWRNKRRSVIVLSSVVVGIIAAILLDGLTMGMLDQMLSTQINSSIGHIQIHEKGFNDNKTVRNYITGYHMVEESVRNIPVIKNYCKRVVTFGLLSSASNSSGVYINGIIPEEEEKVTFIKNSIIQGSYISGDGREIVLGKELAEKLGVGLGDKVVAMSNTPDGSVGSEVFRITGIYETFSSEFDRINIYIPIKRAQQMLNIGDNIHEIAIIAKDADKVASVKRELQNKLPGNFEVLTYFDLLPMLVSMLDLYKAMTWIINLIVGIALIFGIINVMLMAVFERIKEFGVLISVGMNTVKLYMMIVTESFIIGIVGTVLGIALGLLIQLPLSHSGIDLSMFTESLKSYGVGAVIYPATSMVNLVSLFVMIPFISVIAALYPAYKTVKLEPVYAVRHI